MNKTIDFKKYMKKVIIPKDSPLGKMIDRLAQSGSASSNNEEDKQ